jgi:hypothetical protein
MQAVPVIDRDGRETGEYTWTRELETRRGRSFEFENTAPQNGVLEVCGWRE